MAKSQVDYTDISDDALASKNAFANKQRQNPDLNDEYRARWRKVWEDTTAILIQRESSVVEAFDRAQALQEEAFGDATISLDPKNQTKTPDTGVAEVVDQLPAAVWDRTTDVAETVIKLTPAGFAYELAGKAKDAITGRANDALGIGDDQTLVQRATSFGRSALWVGLVGGAVYAGLKWIAPAALGVADGVTGIAVKNIQATSSAAAKIVPAIRGLR